MKSHAAVIGLLCVCVLHRTLATPAFGLGAQLLSKSRGYGPYKYGGSDYNKAATALRDKLSENKSQSSVVDSENSTEKPYGGLGYEYENTSEQTVGKEDSSSASYLGEDDGIKPQVDVVGIKPDVDLLAPWVKHGGLSSLLQKHNSKEYINEAGYSNGGTGVNYPEHYPALYPEHYPARYPEHYPARYPEHYPARYPARYPVHHSSGHFPSNGPGNGYYDIQEDQKKSIEIRICLGKQCVRIL